MVGPGALSQAAARVQVRHGLGWGQGSARGDRSRRWLIGKDLCLIRRGTSGTGESRMNLGFWA